MLSETEMLVVMCHAHENRYAIDAGRVVEVLPCVHFERLATGPAWLEGVFAYRGVMTPLVDLTRQLAGHACRRRRNTRIILIRPQSAELPQYLGLLAERVTTAEIEVGTASARPAASGQSDSETLELLGPICVDEHGMFQLLDLSRVLAHAEDQASEHGTARDAKPQATIRERDALRESETS